MVYTSRLFLVPISCDHTSDFRASGEGLVVLQTVTAGLPNRNEATGYNAGAYVPPWLVHMPARIVVLHRSSSVQ